MTPTAGIRKSPTCPTGTHSAQVFCSAYPTGIGISSKKQGLLIMAALERFNKAPQEELQAIDKDLLTCALPENLEVKDVVMSFLLEKPEGLDGLAVVEAKLSRLVTSEKNIQKMITPERLQEAYQELKTKTDRDPLFLDLFAESSGERLGLLSGTDNSLNLLYTQEDGIQKLKELVREGTVDPDHFEGLKKKIKSSKLPKDGTGDKVRKALFTVFADEKGKKAIFRLTIKDEDHLVYSKMDATQMLSEVLKDAADNSYQEFCKYTDLIRESPVPNELEEKLEVVALTNGLFGTIVTYGDYMLRRDIIAGTAANPDGSPRAPTVTEVRNEILRRRDEMK